MASGDTVSSINNGIASYFTNLNFMNMLGWVVFAIILIGGCVYAYIIWRNRKIFNKKTTDFEIVGTNFIPTMRDKAKTVKLGSGGFAILYLKKMKTWRLAYGGRVNRDTYYFFIMPDGYPYNAMLSSNMFKIDQLGGLIPVVTTNASMRSQYTALEKQIDSLHADKKGFMEKYGGWIFGIIFVLVAGVMLWLMWKEFVTVSSNLNVAITKVGELVDKVNAVLDKANGAQTGGLVKAT